MLPPLPPRLILPPLREPPPMDPPPPRRCATPTPTARLQHKANRNTSFIWCVLYWGAYLRMAAGASTEIRRKPGTATIFPAHFAGNMVTVPGLPHGIRSPFVVSPQKAKHPSSGQGNIEEP